MFEQVLSIVLDSDRVDICQINRGLKQQAITHSFSRPIPAEIKDKGTKKIGGFIKELCSQKKIQPDIVYSALPCSSSMFRLINIPFTDINKLSKIYQYEIEQTLPCALDEVVMDYQIIRTDRSSGTDILASIVPKRNLEEHFEILKSAGIEPHITTLDSTGLLLFNKAFFPNKGGGYINGMIDLCEKKATLLLTDQKKIVLTRQIDMEGTEPDIGHLYDQIVLTLTSFIAESGQKTDKIILTGHKVLTGRLGDLITERLGIKTEYLSSYKKLPIKLEGNPHDLNTFLAAPLGLCMAKRFKRGDIWNFRQGLHAYQKTYTLPRKKALSLSILLLIIIIIGGLNLKIKSDYYKNRIRLLENEARAILAQALPDATWGPETLAILKNAIEKESVIQEKYQGFFGQDINPLDILRELSIRIPVEYNVIINEIIFQNGRVRVKGKTETFEILDKLKTSLDKSKIFKQIKTEEADIKGKGDQVSFDFILEVNSHTASGNSKLENILF